LSTKNNLNNTSNGQIQIRPKYLSFPSEISCYYDYYKVVTSSDEQYKKNKDYIFINLYS
jgi:hypothetical protein